MHRNKRPVCNDTSDAEGTIGSLAGNEIFNGSCIEELDVGKGEDFGEECRGEEGLS